MASAGAWGVRGPADVCLCRRGVCGSRALGAAAASAESTGCCYLTGVHEIAILRDIFGHLSVFWALFGGFLGEVSTFIAPVAVFVDTCLIFPS